MRVESKPTANLGMGKRKLKLRKQQKNANEFPDSSDENGATEATTICPHLAKAVNLNLVKKAIKNLGLTGECTNCKSGSDNKKADTDTSEAVEEASDYTVWLCLQCGNQGCDRNSKNKHALKHYDTPRSSTHDVVLNLTTFVVWCYGCDDEVLVDAAKKLTECVEFVKKQLGVAPTPPQAGAKKGVPYKSSESEESRQSTLDKEENKSQSNTGKYSSSQTQLISPKVKGLSNLGNTCFFNAVMQNLSQTPVLDSILSEQGKKGVCVQLPGQLLSGDCEEEATHSSGEEDMKLELSPLTIRLGDGGALTNSMTSFMTDMSNYAAKSQVITPSVLFGQVCKKAPRFKGFQQQDSHELLRYLLDGMKAEEIKRCQTGILKAFSVPQNSKHVDDETKVKVKSYGTQVKHTFVDSLFGGAYISTVQCEECSFPSQILEPFLDISLPVTEEKTIRPGNFSRKQVKSADLSDDTPVVSPTEVKPARPSKHSLKKERKEAKKRGKKRGTKAGGVVQGEEADAAIAEGETKDGQSDAEEEDEQEDAMETQNGCEEEKEPVSISTETGVAGEKSDTPADVTVQDMSAANSEQNLADRQDEDSDADIEDNDDGSRNSPGEEISKDLTNHISSAEQALGLRGGNSESVHTDSTHKHSEKDAFTCDVGKTPGEAGCRTSHRGIRSDKICDTIQENKLVNGFGDDSGSSSHVESSKQSCVPAETLLDAKPVNGIVKDIAESLKHVHISEKNDEEITSNNDRNSATIDDKENMNINKNLNKNSPTNSRPNTPQSPKLSRSSSLRSSTNLKSRNQLNLEAKTEAMRSLAPSRYQPDSRECSVQSCLNQFTAAELLTGANKFGCENCSKRQKQATQDKEGKKEMVYTNASKQLLIFSPPAVLTLHMKRFQQVGFSLRKVNRHVDFPLLLDIAPYCSVLSQGVQPGQQRVLYSLYGIVEHSGRLTGGHYTAYVKVRPSSSSQVKAFLQYNNLQVTKLDHLLVNNLESSVKQHGAVGGMDEEGEPLGSSPGKWYYISDSRVTETTETKVLSCQAYLLFYERIY